MTPPAAAEPPGLDQRGRVRGTRAGTLWAGVSGGAVVLILLVIFIAQNSEEVSVHFLGASGRVSLAVSLLLSAIAGVLILAVPSGARILQLRKSLRQQGVSAVRPRGDRGDRGDRIDHGDRADHSKKPQEG